MTRCPNCDRPEATDEDNERHPPSCSSPCWCHDLCWRAYESRGICPHQAYDWRGEALRLRGRVAELEQRMTSLDGLVEKILDTP